MRVLLTGASGFIGSRVARIALADGHEVVALVRSGSRLGRLEGVSELQLLEGDLGDAASLTKPLRQRVPDVCLHLAWYAEAGGRYHWARENLDCLAGSLGLVSLLHDVGCPRLVIAGSSFEYEPSTSPLTEASPVRPATLYAAAKHSLFLTASLLDRERRCKVAAARIFSVYGPWEDPRRLVPFVISRLLAGEPCELTSGEQVRDYSHVADVAGALWALAVSGVEGPVNVGSSEAVSVASLAERIAGLLGRPDLLRLGGRPPLPGEPPFLVANTDRLRNEVGWRPRFDLTAGLAETVEWWRSLGGR